eukprot:Skav222011  [mRNA]  locus=scaffold2020:296809:301759:- [translate_table: standard]
MRQRGISMLGIQEARSPAGQTQADHILRLASGHHRGHHGVELWVDLRKSFSLSDTRIVRFKAEHFVVTHADPRILIVHLCHPDLDAWIIVAHAPQSGRPAQERQQWWQDFQTRVQPHVSSRHCWLLMDANARSGPCDHHHVFEHDDSMNPNSEYLQECLGTLDLCLPTTSNVHRGDHDTWVNPAGTHCSRIDYVLLPVAHRMDVISTQVENRFDLGNAHGDHWPVSAELRWTDLTKARSHRPQVTLCRATISRQAFQVDLTDEQSRPWNTDVWTQTQALTDAINEQALGHCGRKRNAPKKHYISDDTWILRDQKLLLARRFHLAGRALKKELVWKGWLGFCAAWHSGKGKDKHSPRPDLASDIRAYSHSLLCQRLSLAAHLAQVSRRLKQCLKQDRHAALKTQLDSIPPDLPAGAILAQLRPFAGPTNLKKAKKRALPFLKQPNGQPVQDPTVDAVHACMTCARRFMSFAALRAHMFRKHGVASRLRKLFDQTQCGACLKEFHTFTRLKSHLRYSEPCRLILRSRGFHCQLGPGIGSAVEQSLIRSHDGLAPTLQSQGPSLPAPLHLLPETEEHIELRTAFAEALLEYVDADTLYNQFKQQVSRLPVTWTEMLYTLQVLVEEHTPDDVEISGCSLSDLEAVCTRLRGEEAWPFLQDELTQHSSLTLQDYEAWLISHVESEDWSLFARVRPVPRFGRHRVLLHAFAGRRRYGDVQHFLDHLCDTRTGIHITTISVDLVISQTHGDLAQARIQGFWISAIRDGQVIGLLCGPPCNSWSRARGRSLTMPDGQERQGPRVIRTVEEAWGLHALTLRELEDVSIGNLLLHFSLWAFLEVTLAGGSALMEHPADLEEMQVSIWKLPCTAFLRQLPGVRFHQINQGDYGASSRKPTGLLASNLPHLEKFLQTWILESGGGTSTSIGTDHLGRFFTAPLKEYSPSLCAAMADAFFHALALPSVQCEDEPPVAFQRLCKEMTSTHRGHTIGADFAR